MKKNSSVELQCPQEEVKDENEEKNASVAEENAQESQKEPDSEAKERIAALINGKDRQQMLRLIMLLQDEGIFHIKVQRYVEAIAKFSEALVYVDHIQSNEVEYKGEDWESLEKVRVPLTLNLSQCKFELGEYEEVVELNNKLLKTHRDNLKAVYQRARAHSALYNEEEARRDFSILVRLDPNFKPIVQQELKKLGEKLRTKHVHEKKNYWSSSQDKWEKKAQTKRNGKTEKKKEVKWADESETIGESLTEVKDDPASFDQGKEGTLNPAGNKEGQTEKKESTDTKQEDCPGLKEGKAEADNKPEDKRRDLAQAEVHKVNLDSTHRSDTDSEVREISLTPAQEEAVKSTAGTDRTGLLKSSEVLEESINSAGAGEQGYSEEPGAEKAEKLAQQSNRLRSAENKKGKAVSSQGKQGKNAKVKTGPKEVSTPSSTASKAPSAKPTSKTTKGKPNKI
ncbi:uncharacterized protein DDB_G0286299-like [Hoplias malabaricus]|uniref:uncharacterized protein DDB_G0286299-like n=1 Tax=Hoplias malabaricus TaxID=27720 RepID=UPI003462D327